MNYLTKNHSDLELIREYTDSTQTVRLRDGRYGFCDGLGGVWAAVVVMIPGYDFVYGQAAAGHEHCNAHAALKSQSPFPKGSQLVYTSKLAQLEEVRGPGDSMGETNLPS